MAITSSISAASATVRAIGPVCASAAQRRHARDVDEILDADRHARQPALWPAGCPCSRRFVGGGARLIVGRRDDDVAGCVDLFQRRDDVLDDISRREKPGVIAIEQLDGGESCQFLGFNRIVGASASWLHRMPHNVAMAAVTAFFAMTVMRWARYSGSA